MYNRKGSLFVPNLKRKLVESPSYFRELIHYIHFNPIHHGFTRDINDWIYTSYHACIQEKSTRISKSEVINWFGDKTGFKRFHSTRPDYTKFLDMEV
jgi:putative transposase